MMSIEFVFIGATAGFVAALAAQATGWIVAEKVLKLPFAFDLSMLFTGVIAGVMGILIVGVSAIALAYQKPATVILRADG